MKSVRSHPKCPLAIDLPLDVRRVPRSVFVTGVRLPKPIFGVHMHEIGNFARPGCDVTKVLSRTMKRRK